MQHVYLLSGHELQRKYKIIYFVRTSSLIDEIMKRRSERTTQRTKSIRCLLTFEPDERARLQEKLRIFLEWCLRGWIRVS